MMFVSLFNFCFYTHLYPSRTYRNMDDWLWGGITLFSHQAAAVQSKERFIDWKLYDKSCLYFLWKRLKKQLSIFNFSQLRDTNRLTSSIRLDFNIKYLQSTMFGRYLLRIIELMITIRYFASCRLLRECLWSIIVVVLLCQDKCLIFPSTKTR